MQHRHTCKLEATECDGAMGAAFEWTVDSARDPLKDGFFDQDDLLQPLHPIFTIPYAAVNGFRMLALEKRGF